MRVLAWFFAIVLLAGHSARANDALIESRESLYNNIYVLEYGDVIVMQFGKNKRFWTETVYDRSDPRLLPAPYTRYLTLALAYPENVNSLLEIGLGGGRTTAYLNLHMPDLAIHSVELDPDVIELAEKYFDLETDENFQVTARDGRIHLVRDPTKHDVILVDAYRGPFVPFHMLTREFYQTTKRRLKPGGVVAQNIEPTTMLFDAAIATMASVFENIDLFDAGGNVVAIGYDGPPIDQAALLARAAHLQDTYGLHHALPELAAARRVLTTVPDHDALVDDFAPVEMLKSIERHNQGIDAISRPASQ